MSGLRKFIEAIPKAELHLHIEGTLEPDLMFTLADRNQIPLKYNSIEALQKAYHFQNLQEFLDIYYEGARVLVKERDFYDLTYAYFERAKKENIRHAEIFFDPQTHTERGIPIETVMEGIHAAISDADKNLGISGRLILSILRHLDEKSALKTLDDARSLSDYFTGVGLDSSEKGNPPSKFARVFDAARQHGFHLVAHAGEEGPAAYIREALEVLQVERIDHGNRAIDDDNLLTYLAIHQIPLTLCPLSNLKLKVISSLSEHPVRKMLEKGIRVTLNSDDPAYFGGYINENYLQTAKAVNLSITDIYQIAENSFYASFLDESQKKRQIDELKICYSRFKGRL